MLHLILVIFVVGGFLTFGSYRFLLMRTMKPEKRERYALAAVQGAFRRTIRAAGVRLTVTGLENIPEDEAVLFIGNHRSFFDVVIGYTLVKGPTGFIAKVELSKVPLLKRWMEELGCRFLDRDNVKQNLKVILAAIKDVKSGRSIWIYPEGTRSEGADERELLPFKDGSFKIAEKTGCKIVPITMSGTRAVLEAHFPRITPGEVRVKVGKPFTMAELSVEERQNIGAYVRARIVEDLEALQEEKQGQA